MLKCVPLDKFNIMKRNPETRKKYLEANKEKIYLQKKEYAEKNKEKYQEYQKQWRETNKQKLRDYQKNRILTDKLFQLKKNLKRAVGESFKDKGFSKLSHTEQILGCSYEEFKQYIESKFESWMSWDNYGNPKDGIFELNKTWDLDHITPLNSAVTAEDVLRLNHYTNLQPLCSYTNRWIKRDIIL